MQRGAECYKTIFNSRGPNFKFVKLSIMFLLIFVTILVLRSADGGKIVARDMEMDLSSGMGSLDLEHDRDAGGQGSGMGSGSGSGIEDVGGAGAGVSIIEPGSHYNLVCRCKRL